MSVVVTEPVTHGLVLIKTTIGDIKIELWGREAPKAVRNFVQLSLEGFYDGSIFHRIVPGFIAQTGGIGTTGDGGECIYDEGVFEDEFNQRLKFSRRGLVAMANQGRNSNMSQFFFTLDSTPELENRNTIFGRVVGDTLFNVLALSELELTLGTERPVYAPTIRSIEILDNPFADIVPRITAAERKEQNKAKREMKLERSKQKELSKRKGTKNAGLLSFGAEPEEPILIESKFKSSHDVLDDPRLRKEVIDDRGTSATLPEGMGERRSMAPPPSSRATPVPALTAAPVSKLTTARAEQAKVVNPNEKLKAEIAKVQADLKSMTRRGAASSDEEDESSKKKVKKVKRTGPSLLELERAKYLKNSTTGASKASYDEQGKRVKGKREEPDLLDALSGFRSRVQGAVKSAKLASADNIEEPGIAGEIAAKQGFFSVAGDVDEDDVGWLSHSLIFRRDATLDRHSIDEYSTFDPLSKNSLSLDELKAKADNNSTSRKYPEIKGEGGRANRDNRRNDGGDRRDDRKDDRGSVGGRSNQSSWKNDRLQGA